MHNGEHDLKVPNFDIYSVIMTDAVYAANNCMYVHNCAANNCVYLHIHPIWIALLEYSSQILCVSQWKQVNSYHVKLWWHNLVAPDKAVSLNVLISSIAF